MQYENLFKDYLLTSAVVDVLQHTLIYTLIYTMFDRFTYSRGNISSTNEILPRVLKLKKLYKEIGKVHCFIKGCYQGRVFKRQSRAEHERVEQSKFIIRQNRARFELNRARVILCHII